MFSDAFVNSSAHITDYSYRYPFYGGERYCQIDEVDDQGEAKVFKENFQLCLPNISDVFDFHMKEGSVECLSIPGSVLIPESVAKRLFDKQSAIGKRIRMSGSSGWQPVSTTILTIGGVYKGFPGKYYSTKPYLRPDGPTGSIKKFLANVCQRNIRHARRSPK